MRYFYTDPLEAAWMSKRFGMQFNEIMGKDGKSNLSKSDGGAFAARYIENLDFPEGQRYYIHPDSLYLLEPRDDDVGIWNQEWSGYAHEGRYTYPVFGKYASREPYTAADYRPPMHTIIQRNGIAFMWPESEAA